MPGLPLPPPLSREAYLGAKAPFIYTGRFTRLVYVSRELDRKLRDPNSTIMPDELRLYEPGQVLNPGTQFMEIINVRVVLAKPARFKVLYRKDCRFDTVHVPLGLVKDGHMALLDGLLGKEVVLLAHGREFYGSHPVNFPNMVFMGAVMDGEVSSIHPLADLPDIAGIAQQVGYVDPQASLCTRD